MHCNSIEKFTSRICLFPLVNRETLKYVNDILKYVNEKLRGVNDILKYVNEKLRGVKDILIFEVVIYLTHGPQSLIRSLIVVEVT